MESPSCYLFTSVCIIEINIYSPRRLSVSLSVALFCLLTCIHAQPTHMLQTSCFLHADFKLMSVNVYNQNSKVSVSLLIGQEVGWTTSEGGDSVLLTLTGSSNHLRIIKELILWRDNGTLVFNHCLRSTHVCRRLCSLGVGLYKQNLGSTNLTNC